MSGGLDEKGPHVKALSRVPVTRDDQVSSGPAGNDRKYRETGRWR